ncbi:hypothetical protein GPK89_00260 [Gemmiger formicilis]|nr:hypothetical protein [Gemmiger formicilis]
MTYDEKQMIFTGAATPEESAALALHYEIATAARAAADSLLDLGREIKRMRDTNGYKALGFETLGDYTKTAIGLNQRQAYNYIAVVEKLPAQLVEQNAAAGVTKLALLAQLTDGERRTAAGRGRDGLAGCDRQGIAGKNQGAGREKQRLRRTALSFAVNYTARGRRADGRAAKTL